MSDAGVTPGYFDHSEFVDWMDTHFVDHKALCAKRLEGEDTLANGPPGGTYLPPETLRRTLPAINRPHLENPTAPLLLQVDSHDGTPQTVRATWLNDARRGGTQDVVRLTDIREPTWALLDPENTGAIAVFVFFDDAEAATKCRTWVCRTIVEEDLFEQNLGRVEPGFWIAWDAGKSRVSHTNTWPNDPA